MFILHLNRLAILALLKSLPHLFGDLRMLEPSQKTLGRLVAAVVLAELLYKTADHSQPFLLR